MVEECVENLLNAVIAKAVEDWKHSGKYEKDRIEYTLKHNPLFASYPLNYIFEKLKEEENERENTRANDSNYSER